MAQGLPVLTPDKSDPTPPVPRRPGPRLGALDLVRLCAALMVVCYHYIAFPRAWGQTTEDIFPKAHIPASYGWLGVELFFLVSGFVICMSSWNRSLGQFFVSRVIRLYPAYWFAVILVAVILTAWPTFEEAPQVKDIAANLTMLQEPMGAPHLDGVYWTLWAELKFYLLFSIVVWHGVTYRRCVYFCAIWTAVAVVSTSSGWPVLAEVAMPESSPFFVAGIAMYLMHRFGVDALLLGIVGISWLLGIYHVLELHEWVKQNVQSDVQVAVTVTLVTLFFALIMGIALGWFSWVRGSWTITAGALTYPLYLIHEEAGWHLIHSLRPDVPTWPLVIGVIAAMVCAAWLIHRLVEKPMSALMKKNLNKSLGRMRSHS